jgi:hypothetical protein
MLVLGHLSGVRSCNHIFATHSFLPNPCHYDLLDLLQHPAPLMVFGLCMLTQQALLGVLLPHVFVVHTFCMSLCWLYRPGVRVDLLRMAEPDGQQSAEMIGGYLCLLPAACLHTIFHLLPARDKVQTQ